MVMAGLMFVALAALEGWQYKDDVDQMGRRRVFASIESSNTVEFARPYQGPQRATLTIRKIGRGTEVMLELERGQFACGVDCAVNVRFDSEKPWRLGASRPADYSSDLIFLSGWMQPYFMKRIRKAQTVRIETGIYHEGSVVFEFNVAGLVWK